MEQRSARQSIDENVDEGRTTMTEALVVGAEPRHGALGAVGLVIRGVPVNVVGEELDRRLRSRAQDSEEIVQRRMQGAQEEIRHWAEYDYVLVNDDLDRTMADVLSILRAERLRRERRIGLYDYVSTLRTS